WKSGPSNNARLDSDAFIRWRLDSHPCPGCECRGTVFQGYGSFFLVAENIRIGPYEFEKDPRGIRVRREQADMPGGLRAVLNINLTEPMQTPVSFTIARISLVDSQTLEFHGYTTDHVSL